MKPKRKRKACNNVKKSKPHKSHSMFIQNCWLPIELTKANNVEHSIKSAFCFKDRVQWFYLLKTEKGFADFEPVHCEFCKGDLWRDVGYESGFSASDTPEVFACLTEHPSKKKTLVLAYIQSNMEPQKKVLLDHLLKHNFSGLFLELTVIQGGLKFLSSIGKKQNLKKRISTATFLNSIKLKKQKKSPVSYAARISELLKEKPLEEKRSERLSRMKFSKLAKVALKKWLKNTGSQNSLKLYKKFKNKKDKLQLQSTTLDLKNELKYYEKSDKSSSKKLKHLFHDFFPSISLTRLRKGRKLRAASVVKGIGSIFNDNVVSKETSR